MCKEKNKQKHLNSPTGSNVQEDDNREFSLGLIKVLLVNINELLFVRRGNNTTQIQSMQFTNVDLCAIPWGDCT